MIHEEICTYEVAMLAKEKGFPLRKVIKQDGRAFFYELPQSHPDWANCDAWYLPTQSLLQRWLREEKGFIVCVVLDTRLLVEECKVRYGWVISNKTAFKCGEYDTKQIITDKRFDVYEEALEDALKYTLENLV